MTTEPERSDRSYIEAAINQKVEYSLGLTAHEVATLKHLLGTWSSTGENHIRETLTIRNIYQRLRRNLQPLNENSNDLSHLQQLKEQRHILQEYRKKLNELEDRIDELEVEGTLL